MQGVLFFGTYLVRLMNGPIHNSSVEYRNYCLESIFKVIISSWKDNLIDGPHCHRNPSVIWVLVCLLAAIECCIGVSRINTVYTYGFARPTTHRPLPPQLLGHSTIPFYSKEPSWISPYRSCFITMEVMESHFYLAWFSIKDILLNWNPIVKQNSLLWLILFGKITNTHYMNLFVLYI